MSDFARRGVRDGLILAGLMFAGYLFVVVAPQAQTFGFDAFAYWSVDLTDPYRRSAGQLGAFVYTPAAAFAAAPLRLLTWWNFLWLWEAVLVGTLVWLGHRRTLMLLAFPPVALELYHANVNLLIAAAVVLGFRYPAAWAFVLLTKVTPGVGLVWFAVRREWRSLAIATGVTACLALGSELLSLALGLDLWGKWLNSMSATWGGAALGQPSIDVPLLVRLGVATLIVVWGARTDRPWTVIVGVTLALPVLWLSGLSILAGLALASSFPASPSDAKGPSEPSRRTSRPRSRDDGKDRNHEERSLSEGVHQ